VVVQFMKIENKNFYRPTMAKISPKNTPQIK